MLVDEDYLVVGNYVEEHIRQRIENGEYVDFARLLPRDRLLMEEEGRLEIVNRNGRTFFVPATDSTDTGGISNFSRWEQAFRVFSNIYTRRFPGRAAELIQYNHIIHIAALTYTWENIYLYDRDFRLHLSCYPSRSWSVILQQAWTMRLKDRNRSGNNNNGKHSGNKSRAKHKDICWHYNAGRCTYCSSCKFEHRCAICNKFGHGAHICHKANSGGDWIILTITKMVMVKGVGHPEIQEVEAAKTGMIIKTTTIITIRVAIQIGKVAIRIIIGNKIG